MLEKIEENSTMSDISGLSKPEAAVYFEEKVKQFFSLQSYSNFYKLYPKVDKDTGVKQGRMYERVSRKYNIEHDLFLVKLENFLYREFKRFKHMSKITKKQKRSLKNVSLDSIIELSMLRHHQITEKIRNKVMKTKANFEKCQREESYFLKAIDLNEPTCDIHCVFDKEKIFLNLVEMEKCRNRTKPTDSKAKEKNSKSSFQANMKRYTSNKKRKNPNNFKILDGGDIPNELYVCQICNGGDYQDDNMIVFCSRCSVTVHQKCYGVHILPETEWICDLCQGYKEQGKLMKCLFCTRRGGAMKPTVYDYNHSLVTSLNPSFVRPKSSTLKRRKTRARSKQRKREIGSDRNNNKTGNKFLSDFDEYQSRKLAKQKNEEFEANLYYNYFRQPEEFSKEDLLFEPRSKKCWVHLSCVYWNPEIVYYYENPSSIKDSRSRRRNKRNKEEDKIGRRNKEEDKIGRRKMIIEGLEKVNPLRFTYKCQVCKRAEGAVVQCVARNCLKSYHIECARRQNVMLSYNHISPPGWRIHCDQHSELLLKKNVLQLNSKFTSEIVKFCKAVDKLYDNSGVKKAQNRRIRDVKRKISRKKQREIEMKKRYLDSYFRNTSTNTFKIKLKRLKRHKYEVVEVNIPKEKEYKAQFLYLGDSESEEKKSRKKTISVDDHNSIIEEILESSSFVEELEIDKSSNYSDELECERKYDKLLVKRKPVKNNSNLVKKRKKRMRSPLSAKKSPAFSQRSLSKKIRSKSQEKWIDAERHPAGKNSTFFQSMIKKNKIP